ncbi:MAG: hypothetical protein ACRDTA_27330 [Pseudonocardiaceae bacterium]
MFSHPLAPPRPRARPLSVLSGLALFAVLFSWGAPAHAGPSPDFLRHLGLINTVSVHINTGGDNLRGGNDNVDVIIRFRDRPDTAVVHNANTGQEWKDNSHHIVNVSFGEDRWVRPGDILSVTLVTAFTGGLCGDNWNVQSLSVGFVDAENVQHFSLQAVGHPLARLIGETHTVEVAVA